MDGHYLVVLRRHERVWCVGLRKWVVHHGHRSKALGQGASRTSGCRALLMPSGRDRNRSSPWDSSVFGRIGCLLHQAEQHAIMNRAETEDGSYTSAPNRKLLAERAAKAGASEYAEPALN